MHGGMYDFQKKGNKMVRGAVTNHLSGGGSKDKIPKCGYMRSLQPIRG